jgi:hypothetical protein
LDLRAASADDYTPFGLVANPWAEARSWEAGSGGTLRTTEQRPGLAWLEPWATRPRRAYGLELGCAAGGTALLTRFDLRRQGLRSSYRSANLFEYAWAADGFTWRLRCFLAGPDALVAQLRLGSAYAEARTARLWLARWLWARDDQPAGTLEAVSRSTVLRCQPADAAQRAAADEPAAEELAGQAGQSRRLGRWLELEVPAGGERLWVAALGRGPAALAAARAALRYWPARETALLAEDAEFQATCPRLSGGWPPSFRRGLVYDFETTRQCLQPPGGLFRDVWPAWMVNWPRAVLAEGSLDMLRLSFAAPALAQRALLSLFRDAPAPNLPCIFRHGEPNMVAQDGSICGTSPAWCVPFYNLRLLYLRTLDRAWLAALYPYLAAYLRWWQANRSDADGWTVYRCTWEAGEDNSPRLDPDREGDHVISQFARPVELQAALADAAATLSFFCRELGRDETAEWQSLERAARQRVQALWDPDQGRFRDWDVRRGGFIAPSGQADYWGADPRRFSPLALTPLLFGQTDSTQTAALRREIEHYSRPPWCDWPSWSYVALEAASAAGWYGFAGRTALAIVDRVYPENDRRELAPFARPLPGAAREYWPTDLAAWDASEGYGWGATTASFVIRQLAGFYESPRTDRWTFRLAPGLPHGFLAGRSLGLGPLPYRGRLLDLHYRAARDGETEVEIALAESERIVAREERTGRSLAAGAAEIRVRLNPGQVALVELTETAGR